MLSLASLAGWEDAVMASIAGATGTAEERDRQIERSGMYGEYPAIANAYLELVADPPSVLEAVKRLVFLLWRGAMATPDRTGIAPLPERTARAIMDALDVVVRDGQGDVELAWMLAWYRAQGAYAFELFGATPRVMDYGAALAPDAWRGEGITAATMERRGQMGRYWLALATGEAT